MIRAAIRNSVLTCLLLLLFTVANGQQPNNLAKWIESTQTRSSVTAIEMFKAAAPTRALPPVKDGRFLQIDNNALASLFVNHPAMIDIELPGKNGQTVSLKLARVQVTTDDFSVGLKGADRSEFTYQDGIHYRGIVDGDNQSVAAMSFFKDEVSGFYSTSKGDYTIGKIKDQDDLYTVYNEKLEPHQALGCDADDLPYHGTRDPQTPGDNRGVGCKVVKVYFETDYKMYQDKGSNATTVTNYVTSFFNQVATLYQNENIDIQIQQIYVWTSTDPYAGLNSTSAVLDAFKNATGANFNGDLAHFLTTRNLGGGIAYINVLCQKAYAFGVSMVYNTYSNVPAYSWTVEVVTHELGHNVGSPHTHSCSWPGGAIDNCYTPEGSCGAGPAPTNGGTIMSYCHLTNYGINFNNGFGTLPGDKIRTAVINASCLTQNGVVPTGLATSSITSNSAVLTWNAVPNATDYTVQYKATSSGTWLTAGTVTTPTITLSNLNASTSYDWKVKTSCSSYSPLISFTTLASGSGCSAPTNLTTSSITQTSATLSWTAVSGATTYTVQYKLSSSGTWITLGTVSGTSTNLTGLSAGLTYNWQVKANCSSYSAAVSFTTLPSSSCTAPTGLTSSNITSNTATVAWTAVSGATSYTVQYKVSTSGTWITAGTTATTSFPLTGLTSNTTYNWQVKANCSAYSATANFTTLSSSSCSAPSGLSTTSITHNSASLNWVAVSGATSYTVQYKTASSGTWISWGNTPLTSISLTGLLSLTAYNWQVKANCSAYSTTANFTTLETPSSCPAPTGLTTTGITSSNATVVWVAVPGAASYTVQYKLATSGTWITAGTTGLTSYNLTGLSASSAYQWQVKTNCSVFSAVSTFTTLSSGCNAPTGLTSSGITYNSATLNWTSVSGASTYTIQIKVSGSNIWTTLATIPGTSITVNGLNASTTYNWQVKANCSGYSAIASFTTAPPPGSCVPPTGLFNEFITSTSAKCNWSTVPGATSYTLIYRPTTSSTWIVISNIYANNYWIFNLIPGKDYIWHVKANCASSFSNPAYFTTPSSLPSGNEIAEIEYKVYPNPVKDQLHLELVNANEIKEGTIEILSSNGAIVHKGLLESNDMIISTSQLSSGMYILRITREGLEPKVLKFVKAD